MDIINESEFTTQELTEQTLKCVKLAGKRLWVMIFINNIHKIPPKTKPRFIVVYSNVIFGSSNVEGSSTTSSLVSSISSFGLLGFK